MSAASRALLGVIGFYRRGISPLLGPRCRFTPTCSEYAQEAVQVHGAARGAWLAVVRIAKCAPWHRGGIDLVPAPSPRRSPGTAQLIHSSDTATTTTPAESRPCPPIPAESRPCSPIPPTEACVA